MIDLVKRLYKQGAVLLGSYNDGSRDVLEAVAMDETTRAIMVRGIGEGNAEDMAWTLIDHETKDAPQGVTTVFDHIYKRLYPDPVCVIIANTGASSNVASVGTRISPLSSMTPQKTVLAATSISYNGAEFFYSEVAESKIETGGDRSRGGPAYAPYFQFQAAVSADLVDTRLEVYVFSTKRGIEVVP